MDKGKKVLVVALAQEPGYFAPRIKELYSKQPSILDSNSQNNINWGSFDLIYILGGNTKNLKAGLLKYNFDILSLKNSVTLIADSAGANLMAKYYVGKNDDGSFKIENGLKPKLKYTHTMSHRQQE